VGLDASINELHPLAMETQPLIRLYLMAFLGEATKLVYLEGEEG